MKRTILSTILILSISTNQTFAIGGILGDVVGGFGDIIGGVIDGIFGGNNGGIVGDGNDGILGDIMGGFDDIAGAGQDVANATCLCYPYIKNSFSSLAQSISSKLSQQESALAKLKNTLKDTNKEFSYQNTFLKRENELMKEEIVKDMELIFYLKQKNELK